MIAIIILLVINLLQLGVAIGKHGESKSDSKHNFWHSLISVIIVFTIYYYAGLFNNFNL
jgi:hypothetical protein